MAALLAGARFVLRHGVRLLPAITRRPNLVPVRCLSASSRSLTVMAQELGHAQTELIPIKNKAFYENWSMRQLGYRLKISRRVSKSTLLKTFEEACKMGKPTSSEAWFLLRACGSYMPEVPVAERTELLHYIWNKLETLGVQFKISHYNTLLDVYLQNEHVVSPTEFLAKMGEANVEPDYDTYRGLVEAFCCEGDIDGASQILESMKNKNFPITEEVFNSLIKGHARAGDMESAKNVLSIMQAAGIEPLWSTHLALLNAYAGIGDIENIRQMLKNSDINVPQKQLISVILTLATSGYSRYIPDVLEHMPDCTRFSYDIVNLCLTLLTRGYVDSALEVCKKISGWKPADTDSSLQPGDFFLRHCVNLNLPIKDLTKCAEQLQAAGMHKWPKEALLKYALQTSSNSDSIIALMKTMKKEELHLKCSYYRHILNHLLSQNDLPGLVWMFEEMRHVNVFPELEILTRFMSLMASNSDAAQAILKDPSRMKMLRSVFVLAVHRELMYGNVKRIGCFLPTLSPEFWRENLLASVLGVSCLRYRDPKLLPEIAGLLFKDNSDADDASISTEFIAHFLHYVIARMRLAEAPAIVEQLRKYLHHFEKMDLKIDSNQYKRILRLLHQGECAELDEDVRESLKSLINPMMVPVGLTALEEKLKKLKEANLPIEPVLMQLLIILCDSKDLPKALQIKEEYKDCLTFKMYMKLLSLFCDAHDVKGALELKKEIDQKGFSDVPTASKYISLLRLLLDHDLQEDALNILKEMQANDVTLDKSAESSFYFLFDSMAKKNDFHALYTTFEYSVMMGIIVPRNRMCSPLVRIHLRRNDLPAAVNILIDCAEKFRVTPLMHTLMSTLMEKEETELLKTLVDRISEYLDEQLVLHELFFAFIRTGRYSEAEKITETPGLRAIPKKIDWFLKLFIKKNEVNMMEKTLELSKKLFECDRKNLYHHLLVLYANNNDWEKAKSAWYKMLEEDLVPSQQTIVLVKDLFKNNGQDVNVHIPELESTLKSISEPNFRVLDLLQEGKVTGAFAEFQEAMQNDVSLQFKTYKHLVKALLGEGLLTEALVVEASAKERFSNSNIISNRLIEEQVRQNCLKGALDTLQAMLEQGSKPRGSSVMKLIGALALEGDVQGIEKIQELTELHGVLFVLQQRGVKSRLILAHLINGNIEEGLSILENTCINDSTVNLQFLIDSLLSTNKEELLEKVSILVERVANQFAMYRPVVDLFVSYIKAGRLEEARHLLQRCNAIVEQRPLLISYMLRLGRLKKDKEITAMVEMLSDPCYKQILYTFMMRGHGITKNVDAAVALYEKAKAEQLDQDEVFLKVLAVLLRDAKKPVPFSEPPETLEYYLENRKKRLPKDSEE